MLIRLPSEQAASAQPRAKASQPIVSAAVPKVAFEERLLRQTLPDARLTVAQEAARKAGHGRYEVRTLWTLSSADLNAYAGSAGTVGEPWPGLSQVSRVQRVVCQRQSPSGHWQTTVEVDYSITSLASERANAAELLKRWRVHWRIEALHWVRDVTFGEDGSQIHTGQAPEAFSVLRNTATTLLSLGTFASIAAGVRALGMGPTGILSTFANLANRLQVVQGSRQRVMAQSPTAGSESHDRSIPQALARARDAPLVK